MLEPAQVGSSALPLTGVWSRATGVSLLPCSDLPVGTMTMGLFPQVGLRVPCECAESWEQRLAHESTVHTLAAVRAGGLGPHVPRTFILWLHSLWPTIFITFLAVISQAPVLVSSHGFHTHLFMIVVCGKYMSPVIFVCICQHSGTVSGQYT